MNRQEIYKSKNRNSRQYVMGTLPTPERHRHQGGLRCGFVSAKALPNILIPRYRARYASPLDLYRDRQVIDQAQYHAGIKFGQAYHHAASGISACHERSRRDDTQELSADTPLARALTYVEQAYDVLTAEVVNAVIDVCAYEQPVENTAKLGALRKGLGCLAVTWGMASAELCQRSKS